MRILYFHPLFQSGDHPLRVFAGSQLEVVGVRSLAEALKSLRAQSMDLLVVHREGSNGHGDPGMTFLEQIRGDAAFAAIPVILTTESWTDEQCAFHQDTPAGANAYLRVTAGEQPNPEALKSMVEAVLQVSLSLPRPGGLPDLSLVTAPGITATSTSAVSQEGPPPEPSSSFSMSRIVLEDATKFQSQPSSELAIQLDAPDPTLTASLSHGGYRPIQGEPSSDAHPPAGEVDLAAPPEDNTVLTSEGDFDDADISPPGMLEPPQEIEVSHVDAPELSQLIAQKSPEPAPAGPPPTSELERDRDVLENMPYILKTTPSDTGDLPKAPFFPSQKARAEVLIPGASGQSPDVETLKKYLVLREQDVETLSAQIEVLKEHVSDVEQKLVMERARNAELTHMVEEADRKTQAQVQSTEMALSAARAEADDLRFQLKTKTDKAKILENKVREAADEVEKLRERVRLDIRKIRTREKELENRLEVLRKDSEVLIDAREKKIVELKQKIDLLEFNMDLLQDRYAKEQRMTAEMRERLAKAAQAMKLAGGLLGDDVKASESGAHDPAASSKKAG